MRHSPFRRAAGLLFASAAFSALTTTASAQISLKVTVIPWNLSNTRAATLNANGWEAVSLRLIADTTQSPAISVFDFGDVVRGIDDPANNPNGYTIGISGPIHQQWTVADDGSGNETTVTQPTPQSVVTGSTGFFGFTTTATTRVDSFWAQYPSNIDTLSPLPPKENSNQANIASNAGNNYTGSPLTDTGATYDTDGTPLLSGSDYGVGSLMNWTTGVVFDSPPSPNPAPHPLSIDIAYLVIPKNLSGGQEVRIYGVVGDTAGGDFLMNQVINPAPEPASVAIFGAAGAALAVRKRRS